MFILPAIFIVFAQQDVSVVDVPVHHLRPSKVATRIQETTRQVRAVGRDLEGMVRISGPRAAVQNAKQWVAQFDVAPVTVEITLHLSSSIEKLDLEQTFRVRNGEVVEYADSETGVHVYLAPVVKDSGWVRLSVESVARDRQPGLQTRFDLKPGAKVPLKLGSSEDPSLTLEFSAKPMAVPNTQG